VKHVVGLSGGKDSTALALRLAEVEPREYEYICNATGNELPAVAEHIARMEEMLGAPVKIVGAGMTLFELIEQQKMLPNFRSRFCTRILKIEPTIEYFEMLPEGSVLYVGLRADEEERKGLFGEDITIRFPMREWGWGIQDVWNYLGQRGITIPKRTDCTVCPYQRLGEWFDLWKNYPEEYQAGVDIEERHGHTFRSAQRDTWPASLAELAKEFARGRPVRERKTKVEPCRVCSL